MFSFQGYITTKKNQISYINREKGFVSILSGGVEYRFDNAWAYPGFIDSHGHIFGLGVKLNLLDLENAHSEEECVHLAQNIPLFHGRWIIGRGWNQELWPEKQFPSRHSLDSAFPDIPVYLVRVDGHSAWVNTKALDFCGIDTSTANPPGGAILKDDSGNPTGVLLDNAMDLVYRNVPAFGKDYLTKLIADGMNDLVAKGLTEVHDMDVDPLWIDIFKQMDVEDSLPVKIRSYVKGQNYEWRKSGIKPYNGNKFAISGVKFYADGALGSRGAALLAPYDDDPDNRGLLLLNETELYERVKAAVEDGFNVAVHAIGDAANRIVLKTYDMIYEKGIAKDTTVLRIEHAQIIHPDDLHYFNNNRITASVQPVHCTGDAVMARQRIGERCAYSYPWQTLAKLNVPLLGGSDFPIESHDPFAGIDSFVRRIPVNETESWYPGERLSREEALSAYIVTPRLLEGVLSSRGKLEVGFDADIVILDRNIEECPENVIKEARVICVWSDGKEVFKNI